MNSSLEKAIRDLLLERLILDGVAEIPHIGTFRLNHTPPQILHVVNQHHNSGVNQSPNLAGSSSKEEVLSPPSLTIEFQSKEPTSIKRSGSK